MGEFDLDVVLSPDRATVRRQTDQPLTTDRRLLHSWDNVPKGAKDEIKRKFFSDRKYTNPRIGGIDYSGTWRVSSVDFEESGNGVVAIRELRLGCIGTLISNSAIDWSEARLSGSTSVTLIERRVIVQWENVDPKKLDTIKLQLLSDAFLTLSNISVGGEPLGGTWNRVNVETSRSREDGAGVVTMVLSLNERSETATRQDGTLKPITDVEYFGVPHNRVADVLPALLDEGTKRTNVSTRISYTDGLANITVSTTNIKSKTSTITAGISSNETEVSELRWNYTLEEIEDEIESLGLDTRESGKTKSVVETSNGDGTWDMVGRVRTMDTVLLADVISGVTVAAINAPELDRVHPQTESETRRYRWFHIDADAIVAVRAKLEVPPTGYRVLEITEDHNPEVNTYTLSWTVELSGGSEWTVQEDQIDAELEIRTIQYLNRPTDGDKPSPNLVGDLAGYAVTSLQVNDPDKAHADYIYRIEKEGQEDNKVVISDSGKESSRIRLELLKRSAPPNAPAIEGYTMFGEEKRNVGDKLVDYIYNFQFEGTTQWTSQNEQFQGEVEVRTVELLNRSTAPSDPTESGYTMTTKSIENIDGTLSNYRYQFQKEGATTLEVRRAFPPGPTGTPEQRARDAEQITETYFSRPAPISPDPTKTGYTLIDIISRGREGLLADYTFVWAKDSNNDERYIGVETPYFLERMTYVEKNVTDAKLTERIGILSGNEYWGDDEIVESVRPRYNGSGHTDLYVVVVKLPSTYTNVATSIDEFDGPFKANTWSLITDESTLYTKSHTISGSGNSAVVDEYGKVTGGNRVIPTSGLSGRQIREKTIYETVAFHRDDPGALTGLSAGFSFGDYTYDSKRKNEQVGYWVKRSTRVVHGKWRRADTDPA